MPHIIMPLMPFIMSCISTFAPTPRVRLILLPKLGWILNCPKQVSEASLRGVVLGRKALPVRAGNC